MRVQSYCCSISLRVLHLHEKCGISAYTHSFINATRYARKKVSDYEKVKAGNVC